MLIPKATHTLLLALLPAVALLAADVAPAPAPVEPAVAAPAAAAPVAAAPAAAAPVAAAPAAEVPATPAVSDAAADEQLRKDVSYLFGLMSYSHMQPMIGQYKLDPAEVLAGINDGNSGAKPRIELDAMRDLVPKYQAKLAEGAKVASAAEMAKYANDPSFTKTASGLLYKVLTPAPEGSPKPTKADSVRVHYTGKLLDGTVFDSSVSRGQPAEFPVTGVIPGWVEGLQLMAKGSKYQFIIPSELAYGATPQPGGPIPPNAVLDFEVELLDIIAAGAPPAPPAGAP